LLFLEAAPSCEFAQLQKNASGVSLGYEQSARGRIAAIHVIVIRDNDEKFADIDFTNEEQGWKIAIERAERHT
jgi:hypothetical protein